MSDPAISDGHMSVNVGDDENSTQLEGTIYVSLTGGGTGPFYFNPVYQGADGSVYSTSGDGISSQGIESEGSVMSQTMDYTSTVTENGKTKTESMSIKLNVSAMHPPEKIVVLQMDGGSGLISRKEYAPGEPPESITPERGAEYLIVETHKKDNASTRQFCASSTAKTPIALRPLQPGTTESALSSVHRLTGYERQALTAL
jgi:hypothetical protein